ncbi:MAG: sigma-54-dependent Fis family transcriptional regulator [Verrucomicrobia bacterium]|nr:sigma-54-dependent Fis family transcriptional regulator [Verrucomicrobiota bacterium]
MSLPLPPVLVVDDEKNMRLSLQAMLVADRYAVKTAEAAEDAMALLERENFLLVITDVRLGGMNGVDFMKRALQRWPDLPFLMITAYATPRTAVEAIKAGATDYLPKPFAPEELLHTVRLCAERYRLAQENAVLRARAVESFKLERIIGSCPKMVELRQLIQTVAASDATVLILGESGTGKELIAGSLHSLSKRRDKHYVRINCAAIPETLLESELFGHEKGAFTGALKQKPGRVEEADSGTIFLDEIGDMSRALQAKLLRFLEDGTFTRVGGVEELRVNVRLISATNRDIIAAIKQGQFREDLFHRLNVVQFRPPPLRERGTDVLELAEHFLQHFNAAMTKQVHGLTAGAKEKLLAHHWPGNVRELRNVIERAVILETTREIQAHNVPDFALESGLRKGEAPAPAPAASLSDFLAASEKDYILAVLAQNQNSLHKAAEHLKISRHALRYRMQRLNITLAGETEPDPTSVQN